MTRITLNMIGKRYENGVEAVRNVSCTLESGTFTVLLGPSGCGKTTILRMIAGLEDISSGELLFDNEYMNDVEPKRRDIGMVFQNYALYPHLSVFENIAFPLRLRRMPSAEINARVREVAGIIGLEELLQRKPKHLSGGQRQRVALGRAIVRKPRVFLFDEPLSNLDAQLRTQMRVEISRIQRLVGSTAVYVTHDQTEAMTMADMIVVLNNGIIQQMGTPQEIYTRPSNLFVASFVGSPTMNFFEGRLVQEGEHINFQEENGIMLSGLIWRGGGGSGIPAHAPITLGIRPEHIALSPFVAGGGVAQEQLSFRARIERVEFLGNEQLAYLHTRPNAPLKIARIASGNITELRIGAEQEWFIAPKAYCLFDGNGMRISAESNC